MKALIVSALLFVVTVGLALAQSPFFVCPPPEKVKPCECVKECEHCIATFRCSDLTTQDQLTEVLNRSGDFPFRVARFEHSTLQFIPRKIFEDKQFRHLVIKDCELSSLIEAETQGESTLFELWMGNVRFQRGFKFQSFSSFKVLEYLYAESIDIKKIPNDISTHLSHELKYLQFIKTKTTKIGDTAFAGFPNLNLLVLKNTPIKTVKASWFSQSLTQLVLSENRIRTLPAGFADQLPNLQRVFVDGNQIQYVEEAVFGHIQALEYLNLEGNPIVCDCKLRWKFAKKDLEIVGDCVEPKNKHIADVTQKDLDYC